MKLRTLLIASAAAFAVAAGMSMSMAEAANFQSSPAATSPMAIPLGQSFDTGHALALNDINNAIVKKDGQVGLQLVATENVGVDLFVIGRTHPQASISYIDKSLGFYKYKAATAQGFDTSPAVLGSSTKTELAMTWTKTVDANNGGVKLPGDAVS